MRYFIRRKTVVCGDADIQFSKLFLYTENQQRTVRNSRTKRQRVTLPDIKRMNDKYSRETFEAIVITNFTDGDYMLTLTFPKLFNDIQQALELKAFIKRLRRQFHKTGKELCYVYVSEYGEQDGHLHYQRRIILWQP